MSSIDHLFEEQEKKLAMALDVIEYTRMIVSDAGFQHIKEIVKELKIRTVERDALQARLNELHELIRWEQK